MHSQTTLPTTKTFTWRIIICWNVSNQPKWCSVWNIRCYFITILIIFCHTQFVTPPGSLCASFHRPCDCLFKGMIRLITNTPSLSKLRNFCEVRIHSVTKWHIGESTRNVKCLHVLTPLWSENISPEMCIQGIGRIIRPFLQFVVALFMSFNSKQLNYFSWI